MLITGVLLLVISGVLFTWYNTAVLTPEEIQRLEAGGSGEDTAFESFALFGSPVIALAGAAIIIVALVVSRKRNPAKLRQYL